MRTSITWSNWPFWLIEISRLGESIVSVSVVRDHILKGSDVAQLFGSRNRIDFLKLLDGKWPRRKVLDFPLHEVALAINLLWVLNSDLPTKLALYFTMVDLMRTAESVTLLTLFSQALNLINIFTPVVRQAVLRAVPILKKLGDVMLVVRLVLLGLKRSLAL